MNFAAIDPNLYQVQLAEKQARIKQEFANLIPSSVDLETFASDASHYRMRTEFRIWHDGDDLYYVMFDSDTKQKVRCDQFLPAGELINKLMPILLDSIKTNEVLRRKLFQVDFLSTLSGEILVSLLYHKLLDEQWQLQATQLQKSLTKQFNINFIGRAKKQKIDIDKDFVTETLTVNGHNYHYLQIENAFTQPNAKVAIKMLEWAQDVTTHCEGDLLELYCGNGNFSIALAKNFNRVLATELAKPSVAAAQHNIKLNQIKNLQIFRMSAEEFCQAMKSDRQFRRLEGVDLKSYQCNTIFVDPPRAGLDPQTIQLVQGFDRILYISCNPETLKQNLEILSQTHKISRFALFDQFPYTHHIESGLLLERK